MKNTNTRKIAICLFLLSSLIFISVFSGLNFQNKDFTQNREDFVSDLKLSAGKPLFYSEISQNDTKIISMFESINFTIDTSRFENVSYTEMQIEYNDNTTAFYDMSKIGTSDNFTIIYTPNYSIPTGLHNVTFSIYDSDDILLNTRQTHTNFTVISNYYSVDFNKEQYHRDDFFYAELFVKNVSGYQFNWYSTIVDATDESQTEIYDAGSSADFISLILTKQDFNSLDMNYYVKIELEDLSTLRTESAYFPFFLANLDPRILENSINLNPNPVLREETCELSFNASDYESHPINITTSVIITDPNGESDSYNTVVNNEDGSFRLNFTIADNKPLGRYEIKIQATDQDNGVNSYIAYLTVQNNRPEINSYTVNGFQMSESVSILYGNDITFEFNVSDVENSIEYVTIGLLNGNGEWFNITRKYSEDLEITIRSIDLITGTWYVYVTVTDVDGGRVSLTSDYDKAPQEIRIVPDVIGLVLPWITLITGAILGALVGIAIAYNVFRVKQKTEEPPKEKPSKKTPSIKKKAEKPKEEEKEKEKPSEKEEEKSTPRKIKRKL
jgi:hypothetical protein